jgi:hypothetical protein
MELAWYRVQWWASVLAVLNLYEKCGCFDGMVEFYSFLPSLKKN